MGAGGAFPAGDRHHLYAIFGQDTTQSMSSLDMYSKLKSPLDEMETLLNRATRGLRNWSTLAAWITTPCWVAMRWSSSPMRLSPERLFADIGRPAATSISNIMYLKSDEIGKQLQDALISEA